MTPGPAMGAPLVSSAGHRTVSHGCPMAFGPLLHAKEARPKVSEWSWSDVSRYSEQPALAPEPTTSTLPKDVDAVDTVAGPVGALVTGVVQEARTSLGASGCAEQRGRGKEAQGEQRGCGWARNNLSEPARQHHHDLQNPSRLGDPSRIDQIPSSYTN